ncbi:phage protein [Escherichia coli]|uniref:Phage protein n=1 Tax=Escherichia coli TaxID=562 RepID=A0A376VKZ8_ECOLX|nr:phage protein [Escherichia coli]
MLYFRAACRKAENFINRKLYEETVPEGDPEGVLIADDVLLALMLLVGHWHENREIPQMSARHQSRLVFLLCWSLIVLFLCRRRDAGGQIT